MAGWIGPALVAAVIAALVSVAGWFVTAYQTIRLDRIRRMEGTRDFQIALRAEIRSELLDLQAYDLERDFAAVAARYQMDPDSSVMVPKLPRHLIFESIVPEVHVLTEKVIGPVVLYMRQRQVIDGLAKDIRDPFFRSLAGPRQLEMYREYVDLRLHLISLANAADAVLGQEIP